MTTHHKNKTPRTRLEIQVSKCYYNDGKFGSYFRVFCKDREGNEYTFSTPFSFLSCLPTEWVEVEAQVSGTLLHKVYRVISASEARNMAFRFDRAKKWGYVIDFKKPDPEAWIREVREPGGVAEDDVMFAGEPLSPSGLTADQEQAAWAWFYGEYDYTHPSETR